MARLRKSFAMPSCSMPDSLRVTSNTVPHSSNTTQHSPNSSYQNPSTWTSPSTNRTSRPSWASAPNGMTKNSVPAFLRVPAGSPSGFSSGARWFPQRFFFGCPAVRPQVLSLPRALPAGSPAGLNVRHSPRPHAHVSALFFHLPCRQRHLLTHPQTDTR